MQETLLESNQQQEQQQTHKQQWKYSDTISKIVEFIKSEGGEYYRQLPNDLLFDIINKHREYGTLIVVNDNKGITAIARWNVDGNVAHVLDVIIRNDVRALSSLCYIVEIAKNNYPHLEYLKFGRGSKYPDRETKKVSIYKFLKRSKIWAEEAKQR